MLTCIDHALFGNFIFTIGIGRFFVPGARLIPVVAADKDGASARVLGVEDYVKVADNATKQMGFFEKEISRKTEAFGRIAHVFSTYESRSTPHGEPFIRGINSIQLQHKDGRWWVVTMFWANELPGQPIPDKYL